MDSLRTLGDALLILAISFWGTATKAGGPSYQQQAEVSASRFPLTTDVVPGKLKVRIFLHDIHYQNETISCWSYVTEGLGALKQKEIIFTLRRNAGQKPEDYPHDILDLLGGIYGFANQGLLVEVGDKTLFDEHGFMGYKDFLGIGYVEPESFPGVETPRPLLAAIMLKGDEASVALTLGLTRVTNLLGMKYRYYPCPPWSDLKRSPVVSRRDMEKSVLLRIPKVSARASYYEEENRVFLSLLPSARERLQEAIRKAPLEQPLALLTGVDRRANASLVWVPNQKQPAAISPPNSTGSRKTGNYLAFVPEQKENQILMVEDGYSLFLTNSAWQQIRTALESGTDVLIPAAKGGGAVISVEWAKAEYTSPVSGETYTAERWTTYKPETTLPLKERVAVSSSRAVLLTSQQDLQARITADDLGGYLNLIEKTVEAFFTPLERRTNRELTIQLALTAAGHEVGFTAVPDLSADVAEDLRKQLESMPPPKVSGPVKLDFILSVWSVARRQ